MNTLEKTQLYVKEKMGQNDVAHDFYHVLRVLNNANAIAKNYQNCDLFVLQMTVLLHDIEDKKLKTSTNSNVKDFLKTLKLDEKIIKQILKNIDTISFSKNPNINNKISIEAKIAQDADRLDAIGAIGVARTFAYGGSKNNPFYCLDEKRPNTLAHFHEKLFRLHNLLNTPEAKEMSIERTQFLVTFYEQFCKEANIDLNTNLL
ncbi:MAG: HD domain-containing protein [Erysipelotrichales bacterium]|nr:HD domain-containing protein [Erysipelotrichales bacterium]